MPAADVQRLRDVCRERIVTLLARFGLDLVVVDDDADIPGSFWGGSEAGIAGSSIYVRRDTPVHSLLHEACHVVCMDPLRRAAVDTDAGGDDLEETAVCYLQILLSDALPELGRERLMQDMDRWGYSFRLGSARRWFYEDADDARRWLLDRGLIRDSGEPTFRARR